MLSSTGMRSETQGQPTATKRSNYHPKRSRKAPAIKSAVLVKRASGDSKAKIARDLKMSVNTVNGILEQSDFDRMSEDGRINSCKLIPASLDVVSQRLGKVDLDAAKFILSNTVFAERSGRSAAVPDTTVNTALSVYIDNKVITPDTDSNKIVDVDPKTS